MAIKMKEVMNCLKVFAPAGKFLSLMLAGAGMVEAAEITVDDIGETDNVRLQAVEVVA
jgi:hypothetical protein